MVVVLAATSHHGVDMVLWPGLHIRESLVESFDGVGLKIFRMTKPGPDPQLIEQTPGQLSCEFGPSIGVKGFGSPINIDPLVQNGLTDLLCRI